MKNKTYYEYIYQFPDGRLLNYGNGINSKKLVMRRVREEGGKAYCKRTTVSYFDVGADEKNQNSFVGNIKKDENSPLIDSLYDKEALPY